MKPMSTAIVPVLLAKTAKNELYLLKGLTEKMLYNKTICVVVPCYNVSHLIGRVIDDPADVIGTDTISHLLSISH